MAALLWGMASAKGSNFWPISSVLLASRFFSVTYECRFDTLRLVLKTESSLQGSQADNE